MHSLLTAGAFRALHVAVELALSDGPRTAQAGDLLWALVLLETRAGELLAEAGVTTESLISWLGPATEAETAVAASQSVSLEVAAEQAAAWAQSALVARQPFLQQVLLHSRDFVAQQQPGEEIGTEHLLWGLHAADPVTAVELQQRGISRDWLFQKLGGAFKPEGGHLQVDFSLRVADNRQADHSDTYRILDASANRAREGLRVIEDYVRFVLDDPGLTRDCKEWRHRLSHALRVLPQSSLLASRDTQQDVGTHIKTLTEMQRESLVSVVQASFKRLEEALRSLSEFSKIISAELAQELEGLRYALYTLEKATLLTHFAREKLQDRQLYLLVSEDACHHGSGPAIKGALAGGVGIVQLREKHRSDREIMAFGRRVREWTRDAGALFIMNDRPDLAVLTDADGVHVGQEELTVRDARRIVGPDRLVGVSTHSLAQARRAVLDGADYLGVGPVFPSQTKSFDHFPGLEFVREMAAETTLPWFAIGGLTLENAGEVVAAGATRIAVSTAICGSPTPLEVAAQFRDLLPPLPEAWFSGKSPPAV